MAAIVRFLAADVKSRRQVKAAAKAEIGKLFNNFNAPKAMHGTKGDFRPIAYYYSSQKEVMSCLRSLRFCHFPNKINHLQAFASLRFAFALPSLPSQPT